MATPVAEDLRAAPRADESVFTSIAPNLLAGNGYTMNGTDPTAQRLRAPLDVILLVVASHGALEHWRAFRASRGSVTSEAP